MQGYNAQLAVLGDGLIAAVRVTQNAVDYHEFFPMIAAAQETFERCEAVTDTPLRVGVVLADNGYLTTYNANADGPERLIAPGRGLALDDGWSGKEHAERAPRAPEVMMREKLEDPENRALYRRRGATVEPVNGVLKDRRGLRRFAGRGCGLRRVSCVLRRW